MAAPSKIVIDQWSPISHKRGIGQPDDRQPVTWSPTWVPNDQQRRLHAYLVRAAVAANVGRLLLPDTVADGGRTRSITDAERNAHREYGDPRAFLNRLVASVLGGDWQVTVDGAEDDLLAGPQLPPRPEPVADGATDLDRRIAQAQADAWEAQAKREVDRWEAALAAQPLAQSRQDALREWADRTLLAAQLHEGETTVAELADAVYVLWPQVDDWPRIEVYDPGAYFPQLGDDDRGQYPSTVHLAWEYEVTNPDRTVERFVRRLTWELVDLTGLNLVADPDGTVSWAGPDGSPTDAPTLAVNESLTDRGTVERTMAWSNDDGTPAVAEVTCLFSNGVWRLDAVDATRTDALDPERAMWTEYRTDLGIDFLPVVHIAHTPSGSRHFGSAAALDHVAQIVDDLALTDTRIMEGASYLGRPMVGVSGVSVTNPDGTAAIVPAPGTAVGLGEKGRLDVLDLSGGIEALLTVDDHLIDRFLQNLGAPGELMGRVDDSTTSGIHLLLKFAPWAQLVGSARLTRDPKYRILLRFVQRMAMAAGVLEPGPVAPARVAFGNFLPTNQAETTTAVATLLQAHGISIQTAVTMLVAAGVPVDDAAAEVARIRSEDPTAAGLIADALAGRTEGEQAAAEWLGVELDTAAGQPPAVTLPPA